MKFLFIGPGYPGVEGVGGGSGIGTYLREITLGLSALGHKCHVLVWGGGRGREDDWLIGELDDLGRKREEGRGEGGSVEGGRWKVEGGERDGRIWIHRVWHGYWPVVERVFPDSRDVYVRQRAIANLIRREPFDWIEFEHDEYNTPATLRLAGAKSSLRVHTTLRQMIETKGVPVTRVVRYRLNCECRVLSAARNVWTNSQCHTDALRQLFPSMPSMRVMREGLNIGITEPPATLQPEEARDREPRFLLVVSPDRRKGIDRIRPVFERYVNKYGPCRVTLVSKQEVLRQVMDPGRPPVRGLMIEVVTPPTRDALMMVYASHDVLFHPARYESFGLTLIEAAAMGKPVVATATGIAPELMAGDLARFMVDGDDPAQCADRLHEAWVDRAAAGSMYRTRYEQGYTRARMTERFLAGIG